MRHFSFFEDRLSGGWILKYWLLAIEELMSLLPKKCRACCGKVESPEIRVFYPVSE